MAVNDNVWFRGRYAEQFSIRGVIEIIEYTATRRYGVRLENGNFVWAGADQLTRR